MEKERLWPIRAIALLLLLQGALLLAIAVRQGLQIDWEKQLLRKAFSTETFHAISTTGFFVPLAALAFASAVGFAFVRRGGWLFAMVVQGLTLLSCLALYARSKPGYAYILMGYSILMVLYINSFDVRAAFTHTDQDSTGADDEPG